jgi:murein DD-endopeptidase MepM/ murein hydrolase activator NlpD
MAREDRFYSFIIAHTSRSRARVQRIRVEKKSVTAFLAASAVLAVCLVYGLYGLTQQVAHLRTEMENQSLRAENERQRQELEKLNSRVEKVEDTSRKLAEKSGVVEEGSTLPGTGGPALPLDEMGLATLAAKMNRLEEVMSAHEALLRQKGYTPTLWPVQGTLEGGFGGRRNPFGGGGYEFHSGQDIEAEWGAPVVSGAAGKVSFVGWQNGYALRPPFTHRRDARSTRFPRTITRKSRIYRPLDRSPPALRSSHPRRGC